MYPLPSGQYNALILNSGESAIGGVLEHKLPQSYFDSPTISFNLGPTGFFGYCALSQAQPDRVLYFSFWDSDEPPNRRTVDIDAMTAHMRERHADWSDPVIRQCLEKAKPDNIYPIFYLPNLPHWGGDGVVLTGDAAHAMPPASGQGGSQAFEDAQTLAMLLAGYLGRSKADDKGPVDAVEKTIRAFYDHRHPRLDAMKAKALAQKNPQRPWSWPVTIGLYVAISVMIRVKWIVGLFASRDWVLDWDVKEEVSKYLALHQ